MNKYYHRDGRPSTLRQWAAAFDEDRSVAKDKVGKVSISTVFLGLCHQFGDGPPLIFETLVFGGELDGEMDRYSTEAKALEGHKAMVARVQQADEATA